MRVLHLETQYFDAEMNEADEGTAVYKREVYVDKTDGHYYVETDMYVYSRGEWQITSRYW